MKKIKFLILFFPIILNSLEWTKLGDRDCYLLWVNNTHIYGIEKTSYKICRLAHNSSIWEDCYEGLPVKNTTYSLSARYNIFIQYESDFYIGTFNADTNAGVFKLKQNTLPWKQINTGLPFEINHTISPKITNFSIFNNNLYMTSNTAIYKLENEKWQNTNAKARFFKIMKSKNNILVAGGTVLDKCGLIKLENNTWNDWKIDGVTTATVNAIDFLKENSYICSGTEPCRIYKVNQNENVLFDQGISNYMSQLVCFTNDNKNLYVSTRGKTYILENENLPWKEIAPYGGKIIYFDGYLYTDGAYRSVIASIENKNYTEQKLYQSYPNPFNPECYIPYELKESGDVKVRIYNILGQKVRELEVGQKQASKYITKDKAAYWNGKDSKGKEVVSGVYYYELVVNGKVIGIKKSLVLK